MWGVLTQAAVAFACVQVGLWGWMGLKGLYKYCFMREKNLLARYGEGSWVVITGSSSGQGRRFALEFAKRGFNIVLTGSFRNSAVFQEIHMTYPGVMVRFEQMNFAEALADHYDFWAPFQRVFAELDVSVLVNNVGHRVAWDPYHEMPFAKMKDTVVVGTIPQVRLTQLALKHFLKRVKHSAIVWITAQTTHPCIFPGMSDGVLTVPYLACYEAANAFGYHHANSIVEEYKSNKALDLINITPGAVLTENTGFLNKVCFATKADSFVRTVLRFMGNVQGETCAYWGHALSLVMLSVFPMVKPYVIPKVGKGIAKAYMQMKAKRY